MKVKTRKTWRNVARNQVADPLRIYWPESLDDVIEIIREAEDKGLQVRAVGSGHSWSDVCLTTGYLLRPEKLNKVLPLDPVLLRDGVDTSTLFQVESGIRIRALNDALWKNGLSIINMGGYDMQTIVGAFSTSTHGSGITLGPIADSIESIDIVSDGGKVYRIERSDGITDRTAYEAQYPDRTLVQEDDWFNAVAVSMGCMGVIYSVILRAMPQYYLNEIRTLSTWEQVKKDLRQGDVFTENRHYEVLINPYKVRGEHRCLITTRNRTEKPSGLPLDKVKRRFFAECMASIPRLYKVLNLIFDELPNLAPRIINMALRGIVDDGFANRNYKVLNIGVANEIPAYSSEIGFPLEDDLYIKAVGRILEIAERNRRQGHLYHTSPISLRFIKGTDIFLSPQYGGDTCMVEIFFVRGTQGVFEMMYEYEVESYAYSGRPHWGQVNYLTGSHDLVRSMYPKYDAWIEIYQKLNKNGTFDSPFSKRVGFVEHTFTPA